MRNYIMRFYSFQEAPPVALIVVSSTPEQKFRRMAIRQSWANWTEEQHVKIIFYIGLPADGDLRVSEALIRCEK